MNNLIWIFLVVIVFSGLFMMWEKLTKSPEQRAKEERQRQLEKEKEEAEEKRRARKNREDAKQNARDNQGMSHDTLLERYGQFIPKEAKESYLQSERWKKIKQKIHERDKICVSCGASSDLQVHHVHYLNLGFENLEDLILLCDICHAELHNRLGYSRQGVYLPFKGVGLSSYAAINSALPTHEELRQEFKAAELLPKEPILRHFTCFTGQPIKPWLEKNHIQDVRMVQGKYAHGFPRNVDSEHLMLLNTGKVVLKGYDFTSIPGDFFTALHDFSIKTFNPFVDFYEIDLSLNKLRSIPNEIATLPDIKILNLAGNQLTELPSEIGDMESLEYLFLEDNKLERLPCELSNLKNLKGISFEGNDIQHVPPEIQRIKVVN